MDRDGSSHRGHWARAVLFAAPIVVFTASLFAACTDESVTQSRGGLVGDSCSRTGDCTDPLRCKENVCTEPPSSLPDGGGLPDGFGPGPGPSADAGPWGQCDECLENACASVEALCGADCVAIEACIETTCTNLTDDESACFVHCQNRFPAGKTQHLALVNCAQAKTESCQPPCAFYPQDYDLCRTFMNNGDCFGYQGACEASLNCKNFRDCISLCGTLTECLACDDTPEGAEGRALLEGYEACVASECLTESWMP